VPAASVGFGAAKIPTFFLVFETALRRITAMKQTLLILCLCACAMAGGKPREWKSGTLVDVTMEKHSRVVGSMYGNNGNVSGSVVQRRDDSTYYYIDFGEIVYVAKRTLTRRHDKQLLLTVNARIRFAIDGTDVYVLDESEKEHKLSLEEKIAKPKPAQQ
jgi:hypothetical protein